MIRGIRLLWIILATLLLAACKACPGSQDNFETSENTCIEKFLAEDSRLGGIRNHASEDRPLAQAISEYIKAVENLDSADCPDQFRDAFHEHLKAWQGMIPLAEEYPDQRGELHVLFDTIEQGKDSLRFKDLLKPIWDTWGDVESAKENVE